MSNLSKVIADDLCKLSEGKEIAIPLV